MSDTMTAVRRQFVAIWYDPQKVEAKAIKAGWDQNSGDGFLDTYSPEEDPHGHEARTFPSLSLAEHHLKKVIDAGGDFWGQAAINEYEIGGRRCRYCTCQGRKIVARHTVEGSGAGIVDTDRRSDCLDGDE